MFEMIESDQCDSAFSVAMSIFESYNKILSIEKYEGFKNPSYFQEAEYPKRNTTLQKIIWFIPDMIRKFFKLIKNKISNIINKLSPKEISNNLKNVVNDAKKRNKSKFIKIMQGIGLTAITTASGISIYKNKDKLFNIKQKDDNDNVIIETSVKLEDINKLSKSVESVSNDVSKLYDKSDPKKNQEKYKSTANKIDEVVSDLKKFNEDCSKEEMSNSYKPDDVLDALKDIAQNKETVTKQNINRPDECDELSAEGDYKKDLEQMKNSISEMSNETNELMNTAKAVIDVTENILSFKSEDDDQQSKSDNNDSSDKNNSNTQNVSQDIQSIFDRLNNQKEWLTKYCGRFTGQYGFWIDPSQYKFESEQDKQNVEDIISLMKTMCNTANYNEYLSIRKKCAELFKTGLRWLDKRVMFTNTQLGGFDNLDKNIVAFKLFEPEEKINFTNKDRLFHTSDKIGLTELKPTFRSVANGHVETLYPSMRVYFSLNGPINRTGGQWNKKGRVYEYIGTKDIIVKGDTELGKPACFIETTSNVPIRDVTDEILNNPDNFVADFGW